MTFKLITQQIPVPPGMWEPKPPRPQCEADVQMVPGWHESWRAEMHAKKIRSYGSGRVSQCTYPSVIEIDGVPMCRKHAGFKVLDMYVKGEIVDAPKS